MSTKAEEQCSSQTHTGIQNPSTHMRIAASVFQHSILAVAKAMSLWRADVSFCLPEEVFFTEQDSIIEITSYRQHSP
jgi:predicted transcriptional regulator